MSQMSPDEWFNRAWQQQRQGQHDAALASYWQALARGVEQPEEAHLNRAVILAEGLGEERRRRARARGGAGDQSAVRRRLGQPRQPARAERRAGGRPPRLRAGAGARAGAAAGAVAPARPEADRRSGRPADRDAAAGDRPPGRLGRRPRRPRLRPRQGARQRRRLRRGLRRLRRRQPGESRQRRRRRCPLRRARARALRRPADRRLSRAAADGRGVGRDPADLHLRHVPLRLDPGGADPRQPSARHRRRRDRGRCRRSRRATSRPRSPTWPALHAANRQKLRGAYARYVADRHPGAEVVTDKRPGQLPPHRPDQGAVPERADRPHAARSDRQLPVGLLPAPVAGDALGAGPCSTRPTGTASTSG